MKKFLSISTFLLMAFFVASCGSSEPDDLPVAKDATASKTLDIVAGANGTGTSRVTFSLSDFSAIASYIKFVKSAAVKPTSTYTISGLPAGEIQLSNVRLQLANDSKKNLTFPTITENGVLNDINQLAFMQTILDEIVRRGSAEVVLSYASDVKVTDGKLIIKIDSNFKFQ